MSSSRVPPPPRGATTDPPRGGRPWYRKKRYIVPLAAFGLVAVIGLTGEPPHQDPVASQPVAAEAEVTPSPTAAPTPTPRPTATPVPTPTPTPEAMVSGGVPADAQQATVVKVTDGDTINVQPEEEGPLARNAAHTIRLLLVDTPETVHPSQPVACYGREASEFVTDHLLGETVWLEADTEDTDRYGRFLRHVWLADGTNFNLTLVEQGYADAVLYEPNDKHWEQFTAAADAARAQDVGLWGSCATFGAPITATDYDRGSAEAEPENPADGGNCDPSYPTVCIPPAPPDLDCGEISHRQFEVRPPDPHGLDGDSDGKGCEG